MCVQTDGPIVYCTDASANAECPLSASVRAALTTPLDTSDVPIATRSPSDELGVQASP